MENIVLAKVKLERFPDETDYGLDKYQLSSLGEAEDLGHRLLDGYDREIFVVIGLDCRLKITVVNPAAIGTVNRLSISPREVLKPLILSSAKKVIVMHNHPSGDTQPSGADISFTKNLKRCLEIFGIDLLDHLIIGDDVYSLLQGGNL